MPDIKETQRTNWEKYTLWELGARTIARALAYDGSWLFPKNEQVSAPLSYKRSFLRALKTIHPGSSLNWSLADLRMEPIDFHSAEIPPLFTDVSNAEDFHQRLQTFICQLNLLVQPIALEGIHGVGKDRVAEAIARRLSNRGIKPISTKVTGFVSEVSEKKRILEEVEPQSRSYFEDYFLIQQAMESGDPFPFYKGLIDNYVLSWRKDFGDFPLYESIEHQMRSFAHNVMLANHYPGYAGEFSWRILQQMDLIQQNRCLHILKSGQKTQLIRVGGPIFRDFMYQRYRGTSPYLASEGPYSVDVLTFLPESLQQLAQKLRVGRNQFDVQLPLPRKIYYLKAKPDTVRERVLADSSKPLVAKQKRLKSLDYQKYLDRLAEAYAQRHPRVVTIIDANGSSDEIVEAIESDMQI